MRYGFVGLGNLGRPLALSLLAGGFPVDCYDLKRDAHDELVAAGATWATDVASLAAGCDALITCLTSPAATASVMDLALPVMRPDSTWIEMSTNDFVEIDRLANRAAAQGIASLACPGTGGVHRARAGRISILVGGARNTPLGCMSLHWPQWVARSSMWAGSSKLP